MHEQSLSLSLLRLGVDALRTAAQAASTLPLLACLTLLIGRRGHAGLCTAGARALAWAALILSPAGLLVIAGDFALIVMRLRSMGQNVAIPSPFEPGMLTFTASALLWGAGMLLTAVLCAGPFRRVPADADAAPPQKAAVRLSLAAALVFFATYATAIWPFAGMPEGMTHLQAAGLVLRDSLHRWFFALCPAGVFAALVLWARRAALDALEKDGDVRNGAARWCALWPIAGGLPHALSEWGMVLGMLLRQEMPQWLAPRMAAAILLTGAIAAYAFLLAKKDALGKTPLFAAGAFCYFLSALMPALFSLARAF